MIPLDNSSTTAAEASSPEGFSVPYLLRDWRRPTTPWRSRAPRTKLYLIPRSLVGGIPLAPGTTSCHSVIDWWENHQKLREMKHWRYIPHDIALIFSLNPWLIQQSYWWGSTEFDGVLMDLMGKSWDRLSLYIYNIIIYIGLSKNAMARKHPRSWGSWGLFLHSTCLVLSRRPRYAWWGKWLDKGGQMKKFPPKRDENFPKQFWLGIYPIIFTFNPIFHSIPPNTTKSH